MMLEASNIQKFLPQRFPFLLVDRIVYIEKGKRVKAHKAITISEYCYRNVSAIDGELDYAYPVSLMIESFSQAAGVLLKDTWSQLSSNQYLVMFGAFAGIRIFGRAYPGDVMELNVNLDTVFDDVAVISGDIICASHKLVEIARISAVVKPVAIVAGEG